MKFIEVQEAFIWPRLDQYNQAWMNEPDIAGVKKIKEELLSQIKKIIDFPQSVAYFENQCSQIEERWARPIPPLKGKADY
jgi:hypothetical protein